MPGGIPAYRDAVEGLAGHLQTEGVQAAVLPVEESTVNKEELSNYRVLYVIDANAIGPRLRNALYIYVRSGGVLVGIGETGRYDGKWQKTWPFAELFGLKGVVCDPWDTGVSWDESQYKQAENVNPDAPLLQGMGPKIDFGSHADTAWITSLDDAEMLAVFPGYIAHKTESGPAEFVEVPTPAITVHHYGRGTAVYCAPLPSGRKSNGWDKPGDVARLLAQALRYAGNKITLPPDEPEIIQSYNQAGWLPEGPKRVLIRLQSDRLPEKIKGDYTLFGEKGIVREGSLQNVPKTWWNSRIAYVDFTDVTNPGSYRMEIDLPGQQAQSALSINIATSVINHSILPTQRTFLKAMRCGERCHTQDPIAGGYHDATGDWGVRMWAMPHLVYGLSRYIEAHPDDAELCEELYRALDWCRWMQTTDGSVYASVRPINDMPSPIQKRPWEDRTQREIEKRYSSEYTATYAAALAHAARVLKTHDLALWRGTLDAARHAFVRLTRDRAVSTKDIGNRLWAAMELYRTTGKERYLAYACKQAPQILKRQLYPGQVNRWSIYGDFFADPKASTFNPQQWKVFHAIGIYLGLIELARAVKTTDPLHEKLHQALDRFADGYLLGMSSVTPYRQMACGLERGTNGLFDVYAFSHRNAWVRDHGLNCDLLAMGTLALELEKDTGDHRLYDMAVNQLNWLLGVNPLGYCMITDVGRHSSPLIDDKVGTGHISGGIPNGIIGAGRGNIPAWGPSWGSREYWLPHNAYLLALIGLLEEREHSH